MKSSLLRIGFWSVTIAFIGSVGYVLSVPLQIFNVVTPLQNAAIAFGFSLLIPVAYLTTTVVLHYLFPGEKRFWTHMAIALAVVYVTYCMLNYVVQLVTVIPAGYFWTFENQQGTSGPLSILNQTPHSLFWDIDGLGYIFLNLSMLFLCPIFEKRGLQKLLRGFLLVNGLITTPCFAIAYFYPVYSASVLMFGAPWSITVPGCFLLLAFFFKSRK